MPSKVGNKIHLHEGVRLLFELGKSLGVDCRCIATSM